jgi:hypothetical protein
MVDADADRGDFARIHANAGEPVAPHRVNFESGEQIDHKLLEPAEVAMQILTAPAKIDDRVTHQLTGTVISRLAAAVDWKQWMREMGRAEQTRLVRRAPDCVNRFVFQKKQLICQRRIRLFLRKNFFL